jgi:hypothetical protein
VSDGDKGKSPGPQLIPRALRDLKRSPIWRQQQEAIAKLRAHLPRLPYRPEQLKTAQPPTDPVVDALAERAQAEAKQDLEPEQVIEQPSERVIEQPTEQPTEPVLPEPIESEPGNLPLANQTSETITGLTLEQIEKELETPPRLRHRPPTKFPHLKEALTDLKNDQRFKTMQPKEEVAFVADRLSYYGDKVTNAEGKPMDKTIGRRIRDWRKGKLKFDS